MPDDYLTTDDLAAWTKTPRARWEKLRLTGDGPTFVKLGHLVRYKRADVQAWLDAQPRRQSTSQLIAAAA